ncbi:MAG: RNA 2',3'-cyclic phosphodiesterase [Candidatus Woesearchaeota archaeon]|jgi:2'-5' RNA ligase|nr:RNA 2',3'-cyclic phosphodiesterase [Candidatus Woesearchaeota archaeon]|tara:strand:+ start:4749 stop:5288 length:540 start_codon:yes stop_codon:yes gene_type:complete
MRLFIAIEIQEDIKEYLIGVQEKISNELAKVRWVNKPQMHLTLKFLGEVQPNTEGNIKEILRTVKFKPFSVNLDSIGVFPNENYIRVVWVGLKPEEKIIELQNDIDESLENLFGKEKDYKPHITLGRVKFIKKENKTKFVETIKNIKVEGKKIEIKDFRLIKSTSTEKGPVYGDIGIFK